jgi:precorrin-6B methylase 2
VTGINRPPADFRGATKRPISKHSIFNQKINQMDLQIKNHLFIIGGATSGFGKAIAEALLNEGANIIAIARGEEKLKTLQSTAPAQVEIHCR